ncbi:histone acetyltransferase p300 [Drosophila suzukii]|uniref:histone acetyltransferase n=1 Tax=Drosophila suzukii TaxID=28584 RepID=A0AB39YW49_DROSZ|nr:histone acetyltransferase p300-like [Drosophila suzukii]
MRFVAEVDGGAGGSEDGASSGVDQGQGGAGTGPQEEVAISEGTAGEMAALPGGPAGGARRFVDDVKKRQIQRQLALLLHAHRCRQPECLVNFCRDMKAVLVHAIACVRGKDCPTKHCSSSRQILTHYKICRDHACRICSIFPRSIPVPETENT